MENWNVMVRTTTGETVGELPTTTKNVVFCQELVVGEAATEVTDKVAKACARCAVDTLIGLGYIAWIEIEAGITSVG